MTLLQVLDDAPARVVVGWPARPVDLQIIPFEIKLEIRLDSKLVCSSMAPDHVESSSVEIRLPYSQDNDASTPATQLTGLRI